MAGQQIRPSQYITTYGPGALLEGPGGPRIIASIENSGIPRQKSPLELEIVEQRLSRGLLEGAGIMRIPANAEIGVNDSQYLYETSPFPSWSLCTVHNRLYQLRYGDTRGCASCGTYSKGEAWKKARREAIRFVMACPEGHLDDVPWVSLVHMGNHNHSCRPRSLIWEGGGGSLRNVTIRCPDCGGNINLGFAYSMDLRCTGRFPEQGTQRPGCDSEAKMIQRGAANLRLSEIVTALTIPERDTRLHQILGRSVLRGAIRALYRNGNPAIEELRGTFEVLVGDGYLTRDEYTRIISCRENIIHQVVREVLDDVHYESEHDFRNDEFSRLQTAASRGAPVSPASIPGGPPLFEIVRSDVRTFAGPGRHLLRITPVSRLRVVMVQKGYRRLDYASREITVGYHDGTKMWYPGVELFGEGIFIDLAPENGSLNFPEHFALNGVAAANWVNAQNNPQNHGLEAGTAELYKINPIFVWWHTLAHRIINALAIDSGYSSAAVRERIYFRPDPNNPAVGRGGILLYTTQPGGDGTLGGMIALVPNFGRLLATALRDVNSCSNDPLCREEQIRPGRQSGAACYACGLISETSCEYRNLFLDRNILADNLP